MRYENPHEDSTQRLQSHACSGKTAPEELGVQCSVIRWDTSPQKYGSTAGKSRLYVLTVHQKPGTILSLKVSKCDASITGSSPKCLEVSILIILIFR